MLMYSSRTFLNKKKSTISRQINACFEHAIFLKVNYLTHKRNKFLLYNQKYHTFATGK